MFLSRRDLISVYTLANAKTKPKKNVTKTSKKKSPVNRGPKAFRPRPGYSKAAKKGPRLENIGSRGGKKASVKQVNKGKNEPLPPLTLLIALY